MKYDNEHLLFEAIIIKRFMEKNLKTFKFKISENDMQKGAS